MRVRALRSLPRPSAPRLLLAAMVAVSAGVARPASADVCEEIGYATYLLARYEARGDTKQAQIEQLDARMAGRPPEVRRYLLQLVDIVYRSKLDPQELGAAVTRSCVVDEDGNAVVTMRWKQESK